MIRQTGKIISLFYYYDKQSSLKYTSNNFNFNNNNNYTQNINNLLNTYLYNMNKMNLINNMIYYMNNMNNNNIYNNNRGNIFPLLLL